TTTPTPTQPQQTTMPQPIFVSGRVMLEDGTAPPESVVIERVCNGNPRSEGYTDSKGYFSFELGNRLNGVLRDASESSGPDSFDFGGRNTMASNSIGSANSSMGSFGSENRFMNCELRARLAGYRSQVVSLANRRPMDNPDVGVILLHRLSPTEG